jgi:hypothetical protein
MIIIAFLAFVFGVTFGVLGFLVFSSILFEKDIDCIDVYHFNKDRSVVEVKYKVLSKFFGERKTFYLIPIRNEWVDIHGDDYTESIKSLVWRDIERTIKDEHKEYSQKYVESLGYKQE